MPSWASTYKKHAAEGFEIVGLECQGSTDAEINEFVKAKEAAFETTTGGELKGAEVTGIPHGFLFGPDGNLIQNDGMRGAALDEKVAAVLVEFSAEHAKVAEKAGKLGEAYKLYQKNGSPESLAAAEAIETQANKKQADAEAALKAKKYDDAMKLLGSVAASCAGTPMAERANQLMETIRTDPEIKANIAQAQLDQKADAEEAPALAAEKRKEFAKALALYEAYLAHFPKATRFAAVKAHYDELKANKAVTAAANTQIADRECRSWLAMADSFIANGENEGAKEYLAKILNKYGETTWAADVKKRLAKMK